MTNEIESSEPRGLVMRGLPWLLGVGGLVLYALTLNQWVSFLNIPYVARLSGWTWQPEVSNPAYFLLTLPVYLLPEAMVPIGLNAVSALCAALVLVQLARCVVLLPHDRTHDQRERESSDGSVFTGRFAWVPPVLAVCLGGLQLTFWEHATNGTPEMLDLLMFAFVARALLEYRYQGRESWLARATLVMGAAMSSNAAMIAFFPLFLAALIWIRGVSFFNTQFLVRMMIFALLGLSLYLLLPLIASLQSPEVIGFWDALKFNFATQKQMLLTFPRKTLVLLSLTSLLPIFIISIRWASYFGDASLIGQFFATAMFHGIHAFFLGAAVWVALDPPFGPRSAGYGLPFLPFYFLGALSAGYFSGYFLLVFGPVIERRMRRAPSPGTEFLHKVSTTMVLLLLITAPVAMVMRNQAELRTTNGPLMKNYAASLAEGLPAKAVLLSDDLARQFMVQAWIASANRQHDFVMVNTEWLKWDSYHAYLHNLHGRIWPAPDKVEGKNRFNAQQLINLVTEVGKSNRVYYLHPSFGYYFEIYQLVPHGLVYELKAYDWNQLLPEKLSDELIAREEAFFAKQTDTMLKPILAVTEPKHGASQYVGTGPMRKIRLRRHKNATAIALGTQYSRALNHWGAELQKAGKLEPAARYFDLAVRLNADNVVAEKNLEVNRKLRAGETLLAELPRSAEDQFGTGRSWDQVLTANGPYDDPSLCLLQAFIYLNSGLYRQSAQCFDRVRNFSETDLESRKWLAQLQIMAHQPEAALKLTREIREHPDRFKLDPTNRVDLLSVETSALFENKEPAKAVELIESTVAAHPQDEQLLTTAATLYNRHERFSNSLAIVDRMLAINSNNATALLNKGYICNQLKAYDQSIAALDRLLAIETNNPYGLLNRGIAYLQSNRLPQAKADYEVLVRMFPAAFQPYFDLSEIALRQGDTNAAIRYAESFLNSSQTNTAEYQAMEERRRSLKGEKPK